MSNIIDPYAISVDMRYLEFLLNVMKECRSISNGKFNKNRGERLYRMKLQDKSIRQLELIIQSHKREIRKAKL